jgi:hypothetical protein
VCPKTTVRHRGLDPAIQFRVECLPMESFRLFVSVRPRQKRIEQRQQTKQNHHAIFLPDSRGTSPAMTRRFIIQCLWYDKRRPATFTVTAP